LPRQRPWSMNSNKTHKTLTKHCFLASNYGTFRALVVCENFVTRKGPSTHVIDATSFV
jgi:hypothetical protein